MKEKVYKNKRKKTLPDDVYTLIKQFINERKCAREFSRIESITEKKKLYTHELDLWSDYVKKKHDANSLFGQNWMYEIPAGKHNRLYKVVICFKYKEFNHSFKLVTKPVKDEYSTSNNLELKEYVLTQQKPLILYHIDAFKRKSNTSSIYIDDKEVFYFDEKMSDDDVKFITVLPTSIKYDNFEISIELYKGKSWNTININIKNKKK